MVEKVMENKFDAWDSDYLTLERSMLGDTISVRWREIRAITGCYDGESIVEGACTIYLEGQLGFNVNHTREEVIKMIRKRL